MARLGCDFLVAGCHKWLFGPRGTGLVWGRRDAWAEATGTSPPSTAPPSAPGSRRRPPGPCAALFEPGGFHAYEHRWALAEAFRFHLDLGEREVADRTPRPGHPPQGRPGRDPRRPAGHPRDPELSAGIVCLEAGTRNPGEVAAELRRQGILASVTPTPSPTCASAPASSPPRPTSTRPSPPFALAEQAA